jgi:hypothetical protein
MDVVHAQDITVAVYLYQVLDSETTKIGVSVVDSERMPTEPRRSEQEYPFVVINNTTV